MGFKLLVDDKTMSISTFSENLDGSGNLTFNVSANDVDYKSATLKNLKKIKEAMEDGEIALSVVDDAGVIVWESDNYTLSNASISANDGGVYFSAYFVSYQLSPVPAVDPTEATSLPIGDK